jgi:hypothetical protein
MYEALRKARSRLFDNTVMTPARERQCRRMAAKAKQALHRAGYPVG